MRAFCIWIVVLAICILIGQIRVGIRAEYKSEGLFAWARLGAFHFLVFPRSENSKEKAVKPQKGKEKKQTDSPEETLSEKIGGALDYAQTLLPIVLEAAGQFKRKLQIDVLRMELTAGGSDPADAAMLFGYANAALSAFWHPLTQAFHVKDGKAHTTIDFDASATTIYADVSLSLKIGQILWLILYFALKSLSGFLSVQSRQKKTNNGKAA